MRGRHARDRLVLVREVPSSDAHLLPISSGRGTLGLLPVAGAHPPEIGRASVAERAEFSVFVGNSHPLAGRERVELDQLAQHRALRLNTLKGKRQPTDDLPDAAVRSWIAPNYLILLDLAVLGFLVAAFHAVIIVLAAILRGLLDVKTSMVAMLFCYWGIGLGLTVLFVEILRLDVWYALLAFVIALATSTAVIALRLRLRLRMPGDAA